MRLIDADKLLKEVEDSWVEGGWWFENRIEEAPTVAITEWISVNDGLPEDDKPVLLYAKNPYGQNDCFIGCRSRKKVLDSSLKQYEWVAKAPMSSTGYVIDEQGTHYMEPRKVTHWMYLPSPPESE